MDSLRYWVTEMHVDGFRFDLAPDPGARAARGRPARRRSSTSSTRIRCCRSVKLIAEPWDLGDGGYQVGNFPRRLVRVERPATATPCAASGSGDDGQAPELGYRLTGSADLYAERRPPAARQHQLRHRARRLHAARPGQLRAQAQRGQRRGQPRRRRRQPHRGTSASRAPTDDPAILAAARPAAAQPARHAAPVAGRADAARRRRDGPHPARQQQRLLPGQRDLAGSTGRRSMSHSSPSSVAWSPSSGRTPPSVVAPFCRGVRRRMHRSRT